MNEAPRKISVALNLNSAEQRIAKNREVVKRCVAISLERSGTVRGQNFEATTRDRTLYSPHRRQLIQPLALSLFHIDPEENFKELAEKINAKKILLIGGGRSMEDLTSSPRLSPAAILNVDPYLRKDVPSRKQCPQYKHANIDATVHDMPQQVRELGYDTFDEIWCTYSIPQYARTGLDVEDSILNFEELLAPGGTIRINPVHFYTLQGTPMEDRATYLADVCGGFSKVLNQLAKKPNIEMSIFQDPAYDPAPFYTLCIHKLSSGK